MHTVLQPLGVVVGITNPKSYILFGAVLPQFVNRAAGDVPGQMLLLALVSVLLGGISDCGYGYAASAVRSWFARRGSRPIFFGSSALSPNSDVTFYPKRIRQEKIAS